VYIGPRCMPVFTFVLQFFLLYCSFSQIKVKLTRTHTWSEWIQKRASDLTGSSESTCNQVKPHETPHFKVGATETHMMPLNPNHDSPGFSAAEIVGVSDTWPAQCLVVTLPSTVLKLANPGGTQNPSRGFINAGTERSQTSISLLETFSFLHFLQISGTFLSNKFYQLTRGTFIGCCTTIHCSALWTFDEVVLLARIN